MLLGSNQLVYLLSLILHACSLTIFLPALHIKAEVVRWVYAAGTKKKKLLPIVTKPSKPSHGGFLSTFSSFFNTSGASTPQRVVTPLPAEPVVETDPLTVTETQVTLSVFSADVDVRLSTKMSADLHRSTKKNPPSKLKFELIYVSSGLVWCQIYVLTNSR